MKLTIGLKLKPTKEQLDALRETLERANAAAPFFTWLGVVPYLTQDAIGSNLDYMASIQNSEVVFDYMEPPPGILRRDEGISNGADRPA